jgi:hypothetical protein
MNSDAWKTGCSRRAWKSGMCCCRLFQWTIAQPRLATCTTKWTPRNQRNQCSSGRKGESMNHVEVNPVRSIASWRKMKRRV